jgi:hypothetical protein
MRHLDIYTGADLNKAGDNKWFTLLCKLPRWDPDESVPDAQLVARSLDLLERAMTGQLVPTREVRKTIADVVTRCAAWSKQGDLTDDRPLLWLRDRAASLRRSRRSTPLGAPLWGWKEPNSHLFLPHLWSHFGDRLRYVHVIRNGVYMARSRNQAQVSRWGPGFGIVDASMATPTASLDYWIASNELAINRGRALPRGAFLLINHDELCSSPQEGVARFMDFLGFDPSGPLMDELASLPNPPKRPNLTLDQMRAEFGEDRLARVRALGFRLEDAAA